MAKEMFNGSKGAKAVKEFGDTQKGFDIVKKISQEDVKPKGFEGEWKPDKTMTVKEIGNANVVSGKTQD